MAATKDLAIDCEHYRAGVCRSCEWLEIPYATQLAQKEQRAHTLLDPYIAAPSLSADSTDAGTPDESGQATHRHSTTSEGASTKATTTNHTTGYVWHEPYASLPENFRNKVKLVVTGSVKHPKLGILRDPHTGEGTDLRDCPLPTLGIRESIPVLARFIRLARLQPYHTGTDQGVLKYVIVMESPEGDLMVRFVVRRRGARGAIFKHYDALAEALPMMRVCSINVQPEHKAIIEGSEEILVSPHATLPMSLTLSTPAEEMRRLSAKPAPAQIGDGDEPLPNNLATPANTTSRILPDATPPSTATQPHTSASRTVLPLAVTPGAFAQTNTGAAEVLYRRAQDWLWPLIGDGARTSSADTAEICAESGASSVEHSRAANHTSSDSADASTPSFTVWDLYCGVGGFGLALAQHDGVHVTGVETSDAAVTAARAAAQRSGVTNRTEFLCEDALTWARRQRTAGAPMPDAIVVNPPRRGIGIELAEWINESSVPYVLYSSCNADTLARDIASMPAYAVTHAQVVDMFPHTSHFETIVLLERR